MARCHPLPRCWLFTDARQRQNGLAAARILPPGSGLVVRADHLASAEQPSSIRALRRVARARKLMLVLAVADPAKAARLGADGVHLRGRSTRRAAQARRLGLITTAPVHDRAEARAARAARLSLAFVSPLYPTRSHASAAGMAIGAWLRLARQAGEQVAALGGMTRPRHAMLRRRSAAMAVRPGWAAIDAWEEAAANRRARQKRNCVPT